MLTVIIILAALALILGFVEIFITPGFGMPGIAAVVCAVVCVCCVYSGYGLWPAALTLLGGIAVLAIALRWMYRSKAFDKMALHTSIDSTAATQAQLAVRTGDVGKALTRLALVGNAEIGGAVVEVKSSGEFIMPGTPVRVVAVSEAQITVERIAGED